MNTNTRYDVNRAGDTSEYQLLMWIQKERKLVAMKLHITIFFDKKHREQTSFFDTTFKHPIFSHLKRVY